MHTQYGLKTIMALSNGINPMNGALLPDDSIYQSEQIKEALHGAITAIEHKIESDYKSKRNPRNNSKKLSADEFLEVVDELESGMNLDQIARMHGTCQKALEKRLVRHRILRPSQKDKNKLIM
jgi:hypothetical protein